MTPVRYAAFLFKNMRWGNSREGRQKKDPRKKKGSNRRLLLKLIGKNDELEKAFNQPANPSPGLNPEERIVPQKRGREDAFARRWARP